MAVAEVDLEMEDLFEDGNIDEDVEDGSRQAVTDPNNDEAHPAEDDQGGSSLQMPL